VEKVLDLDLDLPCGKTFVWDNFRRGGTCVILLCKSVSLEMLKHIYIENFCRPTSNRECKLLVPGEPSVPLTHPPRCDISLFIGAILRGSSTRRSPLKRRDIVCSLRD